MTIAAVVATIDRPTLQLTLASIERQTRKPDQTIIVHDNFRLGAPWARNWGAAQSTADWIVFSDDDVVWEHDAFENLADAITDEDFAYGLYSKGSELFCAQPFDPKLLRRRNYISTMSMVRAEMFPGFDNDLTRLQDWDLWLTMIENGAVGVNCGKLIFRTAPDEDGITAKGADDWRRAERVVKEKHQL